MATAKQLVDKAISQIGYKESPANSNNTKYGIWYGMNYEPWCDMFVSWCAAEVGQSDIGKFAYCPYHVNHFKKNGLWLGRTSDPKPGDIVFFANKGTACHVGIVEKKVNSSTVLTVEGNTSVTNNDNGGAVMRRTRAYGVEGSNWYVLGFARPKYASDEPGWVENTIGWWYRYPDGTWPANCWKMIDGKWYWFNPDGYAVRGWKEIGGYWYWFDGSCAMNTGWKQIDGAWYYLRPTEDGGKPEGSMVSNSWLKLDDKWYYFKNSGAAACNEVMNINGKAYAFNADCQRYNRISPDGYLFIV